MPTYIIERNVGDVSQEDIETAGKKSNAVLAQMEGVTWIRSYVSHADGKILCEYEAPSVDHIREHARRTGVPADKISEIALTVSPDMFR